jgi:hypothetical protein
MIFFLCTYRYILPEWQNSRSGSQLLRDGSQKQPAARNGYRPETAGGCGLFPSTLLNT